MKVNLTETVNMKMNLTEDVIFYKFNVESEMAQKIVEKYAPNKQQRLICDKLCVPYLLWSFYEGSILKYDLYCLCYILFPLPIHKIELPHNFDFEGMDLSDKEKRFISHHAALEEIRQNCVCIYPVPSRLVDLCLNKIIEKVPHQELKEEDWALLLPKTLYQELIFYQPYFRGKVYQCLEKMPLREMDKEYFFKKYNNVLINLFKEIDKKFLHKFVIWFLKDERLCFTQFMDSHRFITIYFVTYIENYAFCLECQKQQMRGRTLKRRYVRSYRIENICSLNRKSHRSRYWCDVCEQVPLFQILNLQEFHDQYGGTSRKFIKEELYL